MNDRLTAGNRPLAVRPVSRPTRSQLFPSGRPGPYFILRYHCSCRLQPDHIEPNRKFTRRMLAGKNTTDFAATILVVDDNPSVRGVFVQWLSDAGYTCVEAGCVADAWASLGQIVVPLTTLDTTLPDQSGVERHPEINEALQATEILMIRTHEKSQFAITALTLGASAYVIKPVVAEELLFQVKKALERRQFLFDKRLYTQHLEDASLNRPESSTGPTRKRFTDSLLQLHAAMKKRASIFGGPASLVRYLP